MKRHELRLLVLFFLLFGGVLLLTPQGMPFPSENIILRENRLDLEVGQQAALQFALEGQETPKLSFSSSAPLVANVDGEGRVTAVSPGEAVITLRVENSLSAEVLVKVLGVPITELTLNAESLTLQKGQRTRLTATRNPGATDDRLSWFSEDEAVVKVDQEGQLMGVGAGTARVTVAAVNGVSAETQVEVVVPAVAAAIEPSEVILGLGRSAQLRAALTPEDSTDQIAAWESTDPSVFTVDESGRITAVGKGSARVRMITDSALGAYAEVRVEDSVRSVEILPREAQAVRGGQLALDAAVAPEERTGHYAQWRSDAPEVASVTDGVVEGHTPGTAHITVTIDGVTSAPATILVKAQTASIQLNIHKYEVKLSQAGVPLRLTAQVVPEGAEVGKVTFGSDDETVAQVDDNGIVTFPGGTGTARVTARTAEGVSDTCVIRVLED